MDITLEGLKEREKERDEEIKNMKEEVDTLKSLVERVRVIRLRHSLTLNVDDNPCSIRNIPSQMFEKHKDAQSESLKDIEQEVKSLKSLLSRRPGAAPESTISRSASPSQPNLSAVAQSYQPSSSTTSSYTPSNSRFGLSGAGASQSGMSPSSSFANIMNRPPGIPAWQMQASASSSSISSSTPPAAANSTPRPSQANEQVTSGSSASENKTNNQDGGYVVDESNQKNDKATTLEESGEIVPSGSETTSREVV